MPCYILLISKNAEAEWSRVIEEAVAPLGLFINVSESDVEQLLEEEEDEPDVIIVDAGTHVAFAPLVQRLRSQFAQARIVVATASPTWKRAREALQAGATDYFRKSFNIAELRERITAVLNENTTPCQRQDQLSKNLSDEPSQLTLRPEGFLIKEKHKMGNIQLLLADNNVDFLATRAEFLENAGYNVLRATSPKQAEKLLANNRVHIALLDIRLNDDNDEQDTTGLTLAKQDAYRSVPKIMMTGYPTYEYVREVLGPAIKGLPPAVHFLSKQEGPEAMITAVHDAVEQHVGINWQLAIEWDAFLSFEQLAYLIQPDLERTLLQTVTIELEDLFRKLFNHCTQITIGKLLRESSGRVILTLFAFYENGQEAQFIVSFGLHNAVMQEKDRFETAVPAAVKGKIRKEDCVQTGRYTAVSYTLHHCDLEEVQRLDAYLQNQSQARVLNVVEHLYQTTLYTWYKRGRSHNEAVSLPEYCMTKLSLDELHQPDAPQFLQKITALCNQSLASGLGQIQQTTSSLSFDCMSDKQHPLPNPIKWVQRADLAESKYVQWGLTHGAVALDTVLANLKGESWLIDYAQVDQAPLLIDFVSLETAVKFHHLSTKELTIRCHLEEALNQMDSLNATVQSAALSQEGNITLEIIQKIRSLAAELTGCDLAAYQQGLFFYSLAYLQQYDPNKRYQRRTLASFVHALLSAAVLAKNMQKNGKTAVPPAAIEGLWLDIQEKEVWVEGKKITNLTPQDFQILHYLYQHTGKLCERSAIAEELNIHYDDHDLLNSAISRLRKKVEPDSTHQKYIKTVRGRGYRLELDE